MENQATEFFFAISKRAKVVVSRNHYSNPEDYEDAIRFLRQKCGNRLQVVEPVNDNSHFSVSEISSSRPRGTVQFTGDSRPTLSQTEEFQFASAELESENDPAEAGDDYSSGLSPWLS